MQGLMKAAIVHEFGKPLLIENVPIPVPGPGVNGGVKPGHWAVQNPASTAGTQASAGRA